MLGGPTEQETCRDLVLPRLAANGWEGDGNSRIVPEFPIVAGRGPGRLGCRRADYLLEVRPGLAGAVVEAKRAYATAYQGIQQAIDYAIRLDLPLAYATNGRGVVEHNRNTGVEREVDDFPTPAEVLAEVQRYSGVGSWPLFDLPFSRDLINADGTIKELRYYQTVAVHRVLRAIATRQRRILLTMATGTGKTFTALRLIYKLRQWWRTTDVADGVTRRVLYLADRDALLSQPIRREFRPVFGEAVTRVTSEATTSREIFFASYQALDGGDFAVLLRYPRNFFDLVVVDECHRGSADEASRWRRILEYFSTATQIGLTATPRRDTNGDTYDYFDAPVFEYSLRQGIEDGYLAPYRVRRVVLSPDAEGWRPDPGECDRLGREIPDRL